MSGAAAARLKLARLSRDPGLERVTVSHGQYGYRTCHHHRGPAAARWQAKSWHTRPKFELRPSDTLRDHSPPSPQAPETEELEGPRLQPELSMRLSGLPAAAETHDACMGPVTVSLGRDSAGPFTHTSTMIL